MDNYSHAQKLLFALKRVMKTQKAAAKAVQCKETTFFYQANYAKEIDLELLLRVKVVLLKHRDLLPELTDDDLKIEEGLAIRLPISMQVMWGKSLEKSMKKRRGRPAVISSNKNLLIRRNCDELTEKKERTDDVVAKKCGLENRGNYRRASEVVDNGCAELIEAMDTEKISIYLASQLARLSSELQRELVMQGEEAIKAYFVLQASEQSLKKLTTFEGLKKIEGHERLREWEMHYQLPLRKTVMGLSAQCHRKGQFVWDVRQLQNCLLLEDVPLEAALDVLCQHHIIEKQLVGKKWVGQFLI